MRLHNLYSKIIQTSEKKLIYSIATVTSVTGSTPQIPGSSAIIGTNKILAGTVGGGPVELAIVKLAGEAIRSKKSGYFHFNLNNNIADGETAVCGGSMNILIDANPEQHTAVFSEFDNSVKFRKPGVLVTIFESDKLQNTRISRYWVTRQNISSQNIPIPTATFELIAKMIKNEKAGDFREIDITDEELFNQRLVFLETVTPPPLLLIAGAGHVGKALSEIGRLLDFEVVVWDSRPEFASTKNLPHAHQIFSDDISLLKEKLLPGKDTFIVIVTHGHKSDAEVLKEFINQDVVYIGMMGSKRKIAQVRQLFFDNGWTTQERWKLVHTPIGIDIGSKTVNEIAISIVAQLIQVRNKKEIGGD